MSRRTWTMAEVEGLALFARLAVDASSPVRETFGRDFGGMTEGRVAAVVRPTSAEQVELLVRFASERGLPLTIRGAGLSQSGQSLPIDGVTVDLRGLLRIAEIDRDRSTVVCEPGVTWRTLLATTRRHALVPVVMPLNLDLTIGGTLSAGGFGSASHRFGPAVSHVASVDVVTGRGARIKAEPSDDAAYQFTLGGTGRAAVIVAAELLLRRASPCVRTFYLMYDDLGAMLQDQRILSEQHPVDHLEGFCAARLQGLRKTKAGNRAPFARWYYGLSASVEHDPGGGPAPDHVLHDLQDLHPHELVHVEDDDTFEFASRYDVRFDSMRATGAWDQPHPWFETILPVDRAGELIPAMLARLPLFLGDGHRIGWIAPTRRPRALVFPASEPCVSFAVLPTGVPSAFRAPALAALADLERMAIGAGGKRYRSGWMFQRSEDDWRTHFGDDYGAWREAKAELDPQGTFESRLFPGGSEGASLLTRGV